MSKFAVIDRETTWVEAVMSVGIVIADADLKLLDHEIDKYTLARI